MSANQGFNPKGVRESDGALLAGAIANRFPTVDRPKGLGQEEPRFVGGFDEFVKQETAVEPQMWNLVKKCHNCGKPCAAVMSACNNCGADISTLELTKVPNLFLCFIFGVDKTAFPLRISMRLETPTMMVYDDPLAITPAHLLATLADVHVPDIRSLFVDPAAGLKMVKEMDQAAWDAMAASHLADDAFRKKTLSPVGYALPVAKLRQKVLRAFNLPPSQFQLHMQYMLPPLLPSHYAIFRRGAHFAKGRHFPVPYVVEALEACMDAKKAFPNAPEMQPEDLIDAIKRLGIDYESYYAEDIAFIRRSNSFLANWKAEDFAHAIVDGKVCNKDGSALDGAPSAKDVDAADKLALQTYGRPYKDGKPGGSYYKFARAPEPLPTLS